MRKDTIILEVPDVCNIGFTDNKTDAKSKMTD